MKLRRARTGRHWFFTQGSLERLTIGGKLVLGALVFCFHGAISLESPLLQLFAVLLVLVLAAAVVGVMFRPRLRVSVAAPASVPRGEVCELALRISNSRWYAFDLTWELHPPAGSWESPQLPPRIASLRPGQQLVVPFCLRPLRRGVHPWPRLRVTSTFPLNLFRIRQTVSIPGEVIVPPAYQPLASFELPKHLGAARAEQEAGLRGGGGEDYLGNREYQPGLPVRRWDYCSWARLGRPVVREYQNEGHAMAAVVVDTGVAPQGRFGSGAAMDAAEHPDLEALLSLAASLTEALTIRSYRIGLLATGPELTQLPGGSLWDQQQVILELLARAEPTRGDRFPDCETVLREAPGTLKLAFLLLQGWGERQERLYRLLQERGVEVIGLRLDTAEPGPAPWSVGRVTRRAIERGEVAVP